MAFQIGAHYDWIVIDKLVWMTRNLDTDIYQNGDQIPNTITGWSSLTTGAWRYYNDNTELGKIHGRLYNRYAVDDPRGLAPTGWRVANETDWNALIAHLGGDTIAGGKLKQTGTTYWNSPNTGATNSSGFSAFGSGYVTTTFQSLLTAAYFWIPSTTSGANRVVLSSTDNGTDRTTSNTAFHGMSVRCVRDLY